MAFTNWLEEITALHVGEKTDGTLFSDFDTENEGRKRASVSGLRVGTCLNAQGYTVRGAHV